MIHTWTAQNNTSVEDTSATRSWTVEVRWGGGAKRYLRAGGGHGDSEQEHGHVHSGHHADEQEVSRVSVDFNALLFKVRGDGRDEGLGAASSLVFKNQSEKLPKHMHVSICCLNQPKIQKLTLATALSVRKPAARLPIRPPTSKALM